MYHSVKSKLKIDHREVEKHIIGYDKKSDKIYQLLSAVMMTVKPLTFLVNLECVHVGRT